MTLWKGKKQIKVLVIEDNPDDVFLINEFLEDVPGKFLLDSADTLEQGIKNLIKNSYDVILLDLGLPDSNEFETFQQIYKNAKDIPLIVLTGLDDEKLAGKTVRSGAQDYIIKGDLDPKLLLKAIYYAIERKKSDIQIRKGEEKYRNALDNMIEGCQIISPEWRYIYVNDTAARHAKEKKENLVGHTMIEVYPGIEDTEMFDLLKNTMDQRQSNQLQNYFTYPDGTKRCFELHVFPVPEGIFILSKDITDNKIAEKNLIESKKFTEKIIDAMGDGFSVLDENGVHSEVNRAMCQMTGFSREELIGTGVPHPYWPEEEHENIQLRLEKILTGDLRETELIFMKKNGERFPVILSPSIIKDDEGKITAVFGTFKDITERKRLETVLKESEQKFKTVADFTYDWEYWVAQDGSFLYVSPSCERISGYKPEEFLQDPDLMKKITHPDYEKKISEHHLEQLDEEPEEEIEFKIIKKSGEEIWISHRCQPVYNDNGVFVGRRASNKDINDRKKAETLIKENEKRYRSLFNYMANGVAVYSAIDGGENFVFKDINRAAEHMDKVRKEAIIGKRVTDVFPGVKDFGLLDVFKRVYKTGKAERYPVSLYQDERISGWRDNFVYNLPSGEIVSVYEDVTERLKAEQELKDINKALMKRDEEFKHFIDSAPVAIAMFDNQMNYIAASNRWIKDYNLNSIEILGRSHYDVFPELPDEWKKVHKRALAGSVEHADEDKFFRRDGTLQYIRWEVHPWYLSSDDIGGIIIFSEDITERRKAEKELKTSEEKYKYVIETAAEAIIIFDKKGTIMEANPQALKLTGSKYENLVGKNLIQLVPRVKINLKEALTAFKQILSGSSMTKSEWEFVNKNGERKFVKANYSLMKKDGKKEGVALVLEDITHLKLREMALKENEQFLENIIENIPDMIFVKSADELRFERVNKASEQIWGYKRDELIGKTDYDFFTKEEADFYIKNDRKVLNNKELINIPEETIHTKHRGERILHTKKIPLLDEKGDSKYILGIAEDITERKIAEEKLKKSLEEKEALLREIHHRVKNNMQIISSLLNLQSGYVHEDETRDVLKDSQSRVKAMAMIHEKLYMSSDLSHVNFKEYVEKLVSDIFYTYGVQIGTIEPVFIIEDIEMNMETAIPLGLIITELVINSLKFAFPDNKGSVTIKLETKGDDNTLIVADDGIGLPENFDFKKTDSLGLELVNNLVTQLDGDITLDSNKGATYHITFKELGYTERF